MNIDFLASFTSDMIILALTLSLNQVSEMESVNIDVSGAQRQFYVYFPKTKDLKPRPVVFAFHGHGGNSRYAVNKFKVNHLWPEAISIYPQGLPTVGQLTDPEGTKNGWQGKVGDYENRDLKFFDSMLKWVHNKAKVNDKAIFCLGHSNGGGFTYLLRKSHPGVFAAIAPFAAGGMAAMSPEPTPVFHLSGTNDPLVKYGMQERTVNYVKKVNQCESEGKKIGEYMTRYESKVNCPVVHYVHPGGHEVPEDGLNEAVKFLRTFVNE
jgi:polyhydroxybutyrate depolymerase